MNILQTGWSHATNKKLFKK